MLVEIWTRVDLVTSSDADHYARQDLFLVNILLIIY